MSSKKDNQENLSLGKVRAQFNLLDDAVRRVISGTFGKMQPADRLLNSYFRENRRCGSRDRALISETVYAMLRYWGFLRKYLPESRRADLEKGAVKLTAVELGALLAAARFIAGDFQIADALREFRRLDAFPKPAGTPERRARQLAEYFRSDTVIGIKDMLPEWIFERLPENLDRESFLQALCIRPPMWLRLQTVSGLERDSVIAALRNAGAEVSVRQTPESALMVRARINLFTLEPFRNGQFEIQDLASQCVGLACEPKPGERWLDACAGAGGKSLQLAALMKRKGNVIASDLRSYKLEDLRKRARRAGFPNIITKDNSPSLRKPKHPFDGVLIDAPCSCSGVWRRNPGAQWKLCSGEISELAAQQLEILNSYAGAVRKGGVLVYATCSLFDEENTGVVRNFLDKNPGYRLDPFAHPLTGNIVPGMVRIDGAAEDCDTLFVARMRNVGC